MTAEAVDDDALETPEDDGLLIVVCIFDLGPFDTNCVSIDDSDDEIVGCGATASDCKIGEFNLLAIGESKLIRCCDGFGSCFCFNLADIGRSESTQFPISS